jgi:hypothetical protein
MESGGEEGELFYVLYSRVAIHGGKESRPQLNKGARLPAGYAR